ncbi:Adenylosuccinate synthase [Methanococcus vannielii SB]|jgi:adenylosuccinate synthase|uniref:Adenylosuccinate synthetase n=1 Tax=Methanococcus vannielii (strain ATCC 35089 / DSM 1224 / JCM 13029 / OCM 148 / SB) TaxID=406327 RepID=PURA_METVS|nr:adenylosuccinate synthetase [Methanococcus vannielii]A6UQ77.1 RecName: Full=Adenylosuccinate synthetase; Short=AMPSase; Short=AdSS; AltName: Full=IMP--aspartate ligase [Methanococcus vannielii SB]ABR54649.1 Adenylosuccinate synthase [Methanococcus vannielii SB]
MTCTIIVGGQWGDEGKGKVISYLCKKDNPSIIARGGVGPNAGHTVEVDGEKYGIRMVPTGFPNVNAKLAVGAGVLTDPEVLVREIEKLQKFNVGERIIIDYRCGVIESKHRDLDKSNEHLSKEIGSTGTGCGPANVDRAMRTLKLAKDVSELSKYLGDVSEAVNNAIESGDNVIIEGTQGSLLSLYYGSYPYVTSKDTNAASFAADVGLGPTKIDEVVAVFKSYPTRVGEGPFPTEMSLEEAEKLGVVEYGTVTGRRRRVGYFDFELAKKVCKLNGATQIAITCLDKYDPLCYGIIDYNELSEKGKAFIKEVEEKVGVRVTIISTGPELSQTIDIRNK